jgi:hypothetical protein
MVLNEWEYIKTYLRELHLKGYLWWVGFQVRLPIVFDKCGTIGTCGSL